MGYPVHVQAYFSKSPWYLNEINILSRFSISEKMQLIDRCFARGSIEEILGALDNSGDPWAEKLAVNMRKMSPTSMKVTFK